MLWDVSDNVLFVANKGLLDQLLVGGVAVGGRQLEDESMIRAELTLVHAERRIRHGAGGPGKGK